MNLFDKNLIEDFTDTNNFSVILFHGYGADAQDLYPLSEIIPSSKKLNWFFPNGPLSIPIGMGWTGRAWWPIPLERYQQQSEKLDISEETPSGIDKLVVDFNKWVSDKKIDPNKLILGGFSQGGMLALNLFFQMPTPPKGLILMSSNLVNKTHLKSKLNENHKNKTYIMSHGHQDPILPIAGADRLQTFLNSAGLNGKFVRFQGGHEIPQMALIEIGNYLNNTCAN